MEVPIVIPKLYESFDTGNTAAGARGFLGSITHCRKCLATEVRNEENILELETTVNDPVAKLLLSQKIIGAKANPHDPIQHFVIQRTERTLYGTVKVKAKHVKEFACQLVSEGDITAVDVINTYSLTPAGVWNQLFHNHPVPYIPDECPFTFYSDIDTVANFYLGFNYPKKLGAILGGEEGSIRDMYPGEYHYDNYNISYLASRGKTTGYKIKYGQNISSAKQIEDSSQTYSHILPYCSVSRTDGKYIYLYSPLYEIPNSDSKTKKVLPLDCSDMTSEFQVGTTGQHYNEVYAVMTNYAARYASANGTGKVDVSIDVTTRAELDAMQQLGLCDTVKVELDDFGFTTTAKITSATYNTLLERWEKMTVGTAPVTLADIILNKRRYNL